MCIVKGRILEIKVELLFGIELFVSIWILLIIILFYGK